MNHKLLLTSLLRASACAAAVAGIFSASAIAAEPVYRFFDAKPTLRVLSVTVSANSLAFGQTAVGASSSALAILLSNVSKAPLSLSAPAVSGPFSAATTCSTTLPGESSCVTNVSFVPTEIGPATGQLVLSTSGGSQVVTLSGTAVNNGVGGSSSGGATPVPDVSDAFFFAGSPPASISFPATAVGAQTSAPQVLELTNTSSAPATLTVPAASGPGAAAFPVSSDCTNVPAGGSCSVTIGFAPAAGGAYSASLSLLGAAIPLSGTGGAAYASSLSLSAVFPDTNVGSSSTRLITLNNTGLSDQALGVPSVSGDFSIASTTCVSVIASKSSCTVTVAFTPATYGQRTGRFTFPTSGGDKVMDLSATGLQSAFVISGTPPGSTTFIPTSVGTISPTAFVLTVRNQGNLSAPFTVPVLTGAYASQFTRTTCGNVSGNGGVCNITVNFTPTSTGDAMTSSLTVLGQTFAFQGTATAAAPTLVGDGVSRAGACASNAVGCATFDTVNGYELNYIRFSNGNLTATRTSASAPNTHFTVRPTSGNAYFEFTTSDGNNSTSNYFYCGSRYIKVPYSGSIPYAAKINYDTGSFVIMRNGATIGTVSGISFADCFFQNYGTVNINMGQKDFYYAVPAGFKAGLY